MGKKRTATAIGCGLVCAALWGGAAWGGSPVALGKRYTSMLRGFSFRTPAGAQRKRDLSRRRLMTWTGRDQASGAVAWTLTVLHVVDTKTVDVPLKEYKDRLVATLKKEEGFETEKAVLATVADRPAVDIRGMAGDLRFWQRQLWVLLPAESGAATTKPKAPPVRRFLIFRISGPLTIKAKLSAIVQAVAGSLKLFDPTEVRKQRRAALERGQKLLDSITAGQLAAAVLPTPRWYLLRWQDKPVGFLKIEEKQREYRGTDGYVVTTWGLIRIPKTPARLLRREMFTTANRDLERWREYWQSGSGPLAKNGAEDGLKVDNVIVCHVDSGGRIDTYRKEKVPQDIYLPRAMGMLLPRLVDLSKTTAYAFASYTSYENELDMRTLKVLGAEKIETAGGRLDTIRLTDRPAEDEEPIALWVDAKGRLLRMRTADGLVMDVASEAAVLRRFPKAKLVILALDRKKPPKSAKKPKSPPLKRPVP